MSDLIISLNNVTNYYLGNAGKFKSLFPASIKKYASDYYDLLGLLQSLRVTDPDRLIKDELAETISLFNECLIAECHGDSTIGSNGLNIYMPSKKYSSEIYYLPYGKGLDFKSDCSWDKLISSYLKK